MIPFSKTRLVLGAFALSPLALVAVPVPSAAQQSDAAYQDLFNAIDEGVDHEVALDSTMKVVRREYAAIPVIAQVDQMSPGLIDEIVKEMRPIFRDYQARVRDKYRPQMVGLFARNLTTSEAQDIAAFYRSELGRRILGGVSRNYSPDATLENVQELEGQSEDEVRDNVASDIGNATQATISELSQDDLVAMGRLAMEKPALLKLGQINPQMIALRAQMEQEQPTPDEAAQIEAVIQAVFKRRLGE